MSSIRLLLAAALVVLNFACSKQDQSNGANGGDRLKVALLSPGPVSDAGWNALAYEGLLAIRNELDAEVAQIQTNTPAEFEEGFRDFARRHYDLVFGHGFEFQDAAVAVAPDYPDTVFITTSGSTVRDNVAPLRFMLEEATYLQGMLAALLSKTGKAGAVGGMSIPSVKSTIMAFRAGARAVRPDFEVLTSYVGNWEDVGAAREATLALVHQGADILFQNADAAGLGVLQVAEEEGLLAFGSNKNQNNVAPDAVLASAVIDIPDAFLTVAEKVQEGRFTPQVQRLGMKEGIITLEFNPQLMKRVPPDVLARIDTAREQIIAGSLVVPAAKF